MERTTYEEKIIRLEQENRVLKERCRILEETSTALLFEYLPEEDIMIFTQNGQGDASNRIIKHYSVFMTKSPLVHPEHAKEFVGVLHKACETPTIGELEYLSKVSGGEYQWHKTNYSSIANEDGRIVSVLGRIQNIHKSVTERQNLIHRVETDYLTGVYNRGTAIERISNWLEHNRGARAQMLMIDIDDFKNVNDTYGHSHGDEILKKVAFQIQKTFSQDAIIARCGGDEFLVFVKNSSIREVEEPVSDMIRSIEQKAGFREEAVGCSVGITSRMNDETEWENLYKRADQAMYDAKRNGKKRYSIYRVHD